VDAVAPAIIGLGIYLMYEAWRSHTTGNPPTPVAKIKGAITGASGGTVTPATTTTGG
jgi:hypothetical protein